MPRYEGSPFGVIHGSIGDVQGATWKGIPYIRPKISPTNPRTKAQQATRTIMSTFARITKNHFCDLILPIWKPIAKKAGLPMSGHNWFFKTSLRKVRNTTRDGAQDPDYSQIQLSSGNIEPSPKISSVAYTYATGLLTVTWDTTTYANGRADDRAFIAAISKNGSVWLGSPGQRFLGSGNLSIPAETDPVDLTSFVYFHQNCIYSPTTPRPVLNSYDEVFGDDKTVRSTSSTNYEEILAFKWVPPTEMTALVWYGEIKNASAYITIPWLGKQVVLSNSSNEYIFKRAGMRAIGNNIYSESKIMMKKISGTKAKMKSIHILAVAS